MTLLSYRGTGYVGINSDTSAIPDPETFADCLQEAFEEVLDLGGEHGPVIRPV